MDGSPGGREFDMAKVIERVNDDPNGPSSRTVKVYDYLRESGRFTNWDLVCFAAEYLGSLVGTLPWLEAPARHLCRLVYMAHYVRFETVAWLDKLTSDGATKTETESDGGATSGP